MKAYSEDLRERVLRGKLIDGTAAAGAELVQMLNHKGHAGKKKPNGAGRQHNPSHLCKPEPALFDCNRFWCSVDLHW